MRPPETDAHIAKTPTEEAPADPFSDAAPGQVGSRVSELLGVAQQTARGMLEAEDNIRLLREQFEQTQELEARGELAAHALDQVEVQLRLMRERRKGLDSIEGKLWTRRNRLERFLIHARGAAWWRARRDLARLKTSAPETT